MLARVGGVYWSGIGRDLPLQRRAAFMREYRKEADLPTGLDRSRMFPLARFLALVSFAVALASCQMFTPPDMQESGFQPSDKPITVDNVV
ncbi:MAG: hypothetical protein E5W83_35460, partial [Mesorhizobium sp.]